MCGGYRITRCWRYGELYISEITYPDNETKEYFPYLYNPDTGQVTWVDYSGDNSWYANGHNVDSIVYVSKPYASRASALRAAHRVMKDKE